jgi:NADH:ubiquinone oxidoreductase subunit C
MTNGLIQLNTKNKQTALECALSECGEILVTLGGPIQSQLSFNTLFLRVTPARLRQTAALLANSSALRTNTLADIAVTDKLSEVGRFGLKYIFLSTHYNSRIIVLTYANETAAVPSLAIALFANKAIFASAGWLEREV